jgi:hypothetical protein
MLAVEGGRCALWICLCSGASSWAVETPNRRATSSPRASWTDARLLRAGVWQRESSVGPPAPFASLSLSLSSGETLHGVAWATGMMLHGQQHAGGHSAGRAGHGWAGRRSRTERHACRNLHAFPCGAGHQQHCRGGQAATKPAAERPRSRHLWSPGEPPSTVFQFQRERTAC